MPKDKDRDLIDKMNSALTEEIESVLKKVLVVQLKPIITNLIDVSGRLEKLEKRMGVFEKEQMRQGKAIKWIKKTLNIAIRTFDREDMRLVKRVDRLEKHLRLGALE